MPDLWFTVLANVPGALIGFGGVWITQALGRRRENVDSRTEYLEGLIRDTEEIVVQLSGLVYAISHEATTGAEQHIEAAQLLGRMTYKMQINTAMLSHQAQVADKPSLLDASLAGMHTVMAGLINCAIQGVTPPHPEAVQAASTAMAGAVNLELRRISKETEPAVRGYLAQAVRMANTNIEAATTAVLSRRTAAEAPQPTPPPPS